MSKQKFAIGYTRVSSTEQKKTGNSLKIQADNIANFCLSNNIVLMQMFEEDYSAASFDRPQFNKILKYLKKNKGGIDLLLVDRQDRFSRDTEGALRMTRKLKSLGVDVNFVSKWIENVDDVDNKVMTTLRYVFAENERAKITRRTSLGTRESLIEGRYTKTPPMGFTRTKNQFNKTILVHTEKAPLIKELFSDYALDIYPQKDLIKIYKDKGLNLGRSVLSRMLSNVLYAGYIDLKKHKIEPYNLIKAQHEPIVPKELFDKVQLIKNGRKTNSSSPKLVNEKFPLTGILKCYKCGSPMRGSNTNNGLKRKNTKYYYYYECKSEHNCNERYEVSIVHPELIKLFKNLKPNDEVLDLFKEVFIEEYKKSEKDRISLVSKIDKELNDAVLFEESLTEKYVSGKIKDDVFDKLSDKNRVLQTELRQRKLELGDFQKDLDKMLSFGITMITNLDSLFEKSSINLKRKILSSNCTNSLVFYKGQFRTKIFKDAIAFIHKNNRELKEVLKNKGDNFRIISQSVPLEKLITNKVYLGFKKLYDLKPILEEAGLYPLDRISPSLSPRI